MNERPVNVCFYLSNPFRKKVFIVLIFNHRLHQTVRDACLGEFVDLRTVFSQHAPIIK